jgi:hypothetical protein
MKTAARRKASDLRRYEPQESQYDPSLDVPAEEEGDEAWDEDYETRRLVAVAVGRDLLPDLGLPSVVDVMTAMFDLVAAGEPVSPTEIASALDMPVGTVRVHLFRGFERLEERAAHRDLTALIAEARSQIESSEERSGRDE